MSTAQIPASCPSCGALFASRAFAISGSIKNLTLIGNKETCPFCGGWANIADGVFDVAGNVLSVVSAPNITKQMLAAFSAAVTKAYEEKKPAEELAKEVEKIDPAFGDVIRRSGGNKQFYLVSLVLIVAAIKSCNLDVKLDANQLIEQIQGSAPSVTTSSQPTDK